MADLLELRGVSFAYGKNEVLKNISFSANAGEYLSLLGVNGSGKTTLLGLLAGFIRPNSGEIRLLGKSLRRIGFRDRARLIAVVTQSAELSFPFSCLEIVLMGLNPHMGRFQSVSDEQLEAARQIMEGCDVWRFADKPITEISGGERQRVLLARALLQSPKLLLLDEAMSELDVAAKCSMMKLLRARVKQEQLCVIAVHHDLSTAYRYSDRVCALKNGEIYADGPPSSVMDESFFQSVFSVDAEIIEHKGFIINDNI